MLPWLIRAFDELEQHVHELPGTATHLRIKLYLDSLKEKLGPAGDED